MASFIVAPNLTFVHRYRIVDFEVICWLKHMIWSAVYTALGSLPSNLLVMETKGGS